MSECVAAAAAIAAACAGAGGAPAGAGGPGGRVVDRRPRPPLPPGVPGLVYGPLAGRPGLAKQTARPRCPRARRRPGLRRFEVPCVLCGPRLAPPVQARPDRPDPAQPAPRAGGAGWFGRPGAPRTRTLDPSLGYMDDAAAADGSARTTGGDSDWRPLTARARAA